MTTTETLRRAAALMRERAKACTPAGPWHFLEVETGDGELHGDVRAAIGETGYTVAEVDYANNAEHIASWHPIVALAVAGLLEAEASIQALYPNRDDDDIAHALAVAAAYLNEEPSP